MKPLEEIILKTLKKAQGVSPDSLAADSKLINLQNELLNEIHTVYNPIQVVTEAIKNDPDLYQAWQSNIAMSFKDLVKYNQFLEDVPIIVFDAYQVDELANQAAKNFINLLCDIKPILQEVAD